MQVFIFINLFNSKNSNYHSVDVEPGQLENLLLSWLYCSIVHILYKVECPDLSDLVI